MQHFKPTSASPRPAQRQRGVALFTVIVFVLLSMLLALWASRTAWFNELVVGNDADYQRAFEAAQALMLDAELDILGEQSDGTACSGSGAVCRKSGVPEIPLEGPSQLEEAILLLEELADAKLGSVHVRCKHGLCAKRLGRQDFWNYTSGVTPDPAPSAAEVSLSSLAQAGVGARYGTYTGAKPDDNPILSDTSAADKGGWYWIEVLPYDKEACESKRLVIDPTKGKEDCLDVGSVVYRITALAYGLKEGNMVVLQETYAPTRRVN